MEMVSKRMARNAQRAFTELLTLRIKSKDARFVKIPNGVNTGLIVRCVNTRRMKCVLCRAISVRITKIVLKGNNMAEQEKRCENGLHRFEQGSRICICKQRVIPESKFKFNDIYIDWGKGTRRSRSIKNNKEFQ
jgi:hypothetical protein